MMSNLRPLWSHSSISEISKPPLRAADLLTLTHFTLPPWTDTLLFRQSIPSPLCCKTALKSTSSCDIHQSIEAVQAISVAPELLSWLEHETIGDGAGSYIACACTTRTPSVMLRSLASNHIARPTCRSSLSRPNTDRSTHPKKSPPTISAEDTFDPSSCCHLH